MPCLAPPSPQVPLADGPVACAVAQGLRRQVVPCSALLPVAGPRPGVQTTHPEMLLLLDRRTRNAFATCGRVLQLAFAEL